MRIAFVMAGAPRWHPLWSQVADGLRYRGAEVAFLWPDTSTTDLDRLRVEHDLYVLKCGAGRGLSLAAALHAMGAVTFNPYPAVALCRDKIAVSAVLSAAGVPVPASWLLADGRRARGLLEAGPLVLKPYRGSRGVGVRVIRSAAELEPFCEQAEPIYVQRYHEPDGPDRKIYMIGGAAFGVRRVWPAKSAAAKAGAAFVPAADMCDIADALAAVLGLETFGFDVIYSSGRLLVVDVSALPGFKGVPGAQWKLVDVIEAAACRAVESRPRPVPA